MDKFDVRNNKIWGNAREIRARRVEKICVLKIKGVLSTNLDIWGSPGSEEGWERSHTSGTNRHLKLPLQDMLNLFLELFL